MFVCVHVCTCLEVCMCVPACLSPHIPVPLSTTMPTVIWMRVPHCIALHVSVWHGACVHLPRSACEREWGLFSP